MDLLWGAFSRFSHLWMTKNSREPACGGLDADLGPREHMAKSAPATAGALVSFPWAVRPAGPLASLVRAKSSSNYDVLTNVLSTEPENKWYSFKNTTVRKKKKKKHSKADQFLTWAGKSWIVALPLTLRMENQLGLTGCPPARPRMAPSASKTVIG